MNRIVFSGALGALLLTSFACASESAPPAGDDAAVDPTANAPAVEAPAPAAVPPVADANLAAVEERLLSANSFLLEYQVRASGSFSADISGDLEVGSGDQLGIYGTGTFGGEPVELSLISSDGYMRGGNGAVNIDESVPAALKEAVVIGLTRMGILHNLARLTADQAPDHASGGVASWVEAVDVAPAAGDPPVENAVSGISFGIVVDGQPAGNATLWLDENGLPVYRVQRVDFEGGSMEVVEEYEMVEIRP